MNFCVKCKQKWAKFEESELNIFEYICKKNITKYLHVNPYIIVFVMGRKRFGFVETWFYNMDISFCSNFRVLYGK